MGTPDEPDQAERAVERDVADLVPVLREAPLRIRVRNGEKPHDEA